MELFLLYLNAFLRPILAMDLTLGGSESAIEMLYDWAAILLFSILGVAFFANAAMRKRVRLTEIDLVIAGFVVWCVAGYLIYIDRTSARELIKLIFPLFVYVVAKNVLTNVEQYRRMLWLMIVAFTVPVVASTTLIALGKGVENVNYWTNYPRYEGIYNGVHNLGHNMLFILMLIAMYVTVHEGIGDNKKVAVGRVKKPYLVAMAISAIFCLVMSQTRTQLLGFVLFTSYYLFVFQRRAFYLMCAVATVILIAFSPVLINTPIMKSLLYDYNKVETGAWNDQELASGRPRIWKQNLDIFKSLPIDRQIAGAGIGNKNESGTDGIIDSHNDYLEIMMDTGIVGLFLYLTLQVLILRKILRLPGPEKHVFLGVFIAVALMNVSSNSYVTRSALAQMLFLVLAYIELSSAAGPQKRTEPTAVHR